jgi:hypothetical protein
MAVVVTDYGTHIAIHLDHPETTCWVCGEDSTLDNCGIPVYEDFVLPNDWQGEWGGVPSCRRCFEKQGKLSKPMLASDLRRAEERQGEDMTHEPLIKLGQVSSNPRAGFQQPAHPSIGYICGECGKCSTGAEQPPWFWWAEMYWCSTCFEPGMPVKREMKP